VVDPDDMLQRYGADALRLYVMFVAPPEKEVEWSDAGLEGSWRFLARVWRVVEHWAGSARSAAGIDAPSDLSEAERALRRKTHETIGRVTVDIDERVHLNTPVSALMELVNELYAFSEQSSLGAPAGRGGADDASVRSDARVQTCFVVREAVEALVLMLSPFAPHTCEELWERLGHADGLVTAPWPAFDPELAKPEAVVIPVQVNGKLRGRLTVAADVPDERLRELALADPAVQAHVAGKTVRKVIVASGKLVSVVVQ
jgi:leucyl-tRNA synthetase